MSCHSHNTDGPRIDREKRTIEAMVRVYCSDHHRGPDGLCPECDKLLDYAKRRLGGCLFQEAKPVCNKCSVHCFSPKMRARVQAVMRYSGPRMLFRHPILSLRHLVDKFRKVPTLPQTRRR
jgi:hypothetical protein